MSVRRPLGVWVESAADNMTSVNRPRHAREITREWVKLWCDLSYNLMSYMVDTTNQSVRQCSVKMDTVKIHR